MYTGIGEFFIRIYPVVLKKKRNTVYRLTQHSNAIQHSATCFGTLEPSSGTFITTVFSLYWRYNPFWVCILQPSSGALASSFSRFLDHTQRRATVGRTPLDE